MKVMKVMKVMEVMEVMEVKVLTDILLYQYEQVRLEVVRHQAGVEEQS